MIRRAAQPDPLHKIGEILSNAHYDNHAQNCYRRIHVPAPRISRLFFAAMPWTALVWKRLVVAIVLEAMQFQMLYSTLLSSSYPTPAQNSHNSCYKSRHLS